MDDYITKDYFQKELKKELKLAFQDFNIELQHHFDVFGAQLIGFLEPRFQAIEKRLDNCATKDDFNTAINLLDTHIKRMDRKDIEDEARNSQLNRHETWIDQLAHKTDTKLSY